ncbi:hypothetical protein D3C84_1198470 [compost metagenome]
MRVRSEKSVKVARISGMLKLAVSIDAVSRVIFTRTTSDNESAKAISSYNLWLDWRDNNRIARV